MIHLKTIAAFHDYRQLEKPSHPLISVIDVGSVPEISLEAPEPIVLDFYSIAVKRMHNVKAKYGQHQFDFNEGIMSFMAPHQVLNISVDDKQKTIKKSGWVVYIHPDFLWNTSLAKTIRKYDFWDYSLHEALYLSAHEEETMNAIAQNIQRECSGNIDKFSKQIIISHIESLLNYADRFYHRQFITREKINHNLIDRLNELLTLYFNSDDLIERGLPSVAYVAEQLHLSPKYLSNMLRVITGQSTQQFIHDKLIEKAKEKLTSTQLTVSEVAYELGFAHLQSFSKLFKTKTKLTPQKFRASFN